MVSKSVAWERSVRFLRVLKKIGVNDSCIYPELICFWNSGSLNDWVLDEVLFLNNIAPTLIFSQFLCPHLGLFARPPKPPATQAKSEAIYHRELTKF